MSATTLYDRIFSTGLSPSDPYTERTIAQAIHVYFQGMWRPAIAFALMPLVVMWGMWSHVDHVALISWTVVGLAMNVVSLLVIRAYLTRKPPESEARKWGRYVAYLSLGTGIIWGSTSLLFIVTDSVALQVLLLVFLISLCGGSISLHAYWLESYYALILPVFTLLILSMLLAEDSTYRALAVGLIPGIVILMHVGQNVFKATLASIRLRFENLDLVEQLRAEKEKVEAASKDKTRFLASASHDLRQPVHALSLFTHALRHELQGHKGMSLLGDMERSIEALNQLLTSLLDISKLDAGIVEPDKTHFPLDDTLRVLETEYEMQARAKGLDYHVHAAQGVAVYSDRALLDTILRNLISNAIRYTTRGRIDVSIRSNPDQVRIEVRDTGVGIAPHQREDVFREFYQIGNSERDRTKGLGLGLAIVKRLTLLLEHRIELESEPGAGSCFTVVLPKGDYRAMASPEVQSSHLASRDIEGMRILVIDDEVAVREGMLAVLTGWGCQVILAGSADEALVKVKRGITLHALISDYRLRDENTGVQAIRRVCESLNTEIPALIITGDTDPNRLREVQSSGFALMHKPVQPGKLRAYLRSVQRRKS